VDLSAAADLGVALAGIVGGEHVVAGDGAAAYAVEGRAARWAVFPGTAEAVGQCLRLASEHGLAVAPTGQGTRRHWGSVPRRLDLAVSLRRLDRILVHEPADLTVSIEAGVTLGALAARIRPFGQLCPLDPPRAPGSTVGGIVATAASGPYRARYGTVRDLLLGVTVARADGTLVTGGGRVVKNATGYDMPKLFVGALGTLGVVVAVHLRLHPAPPVEATWRYDFATVDAALEAALGVMDAPVVASRLQLVDGATLAALGPGASGGAALAVTIGSVAEGVRAQAERVAEIARRGGGTGSPVSDADAWWERVREAAWASGADRLLTLRVGTRPADVVKALRVVEAVAARRAAIRSTAEVPGGVLHLTLAGPGVSDAPALVGEIRAGLGALDGTCVVEHAPPAVKGGLDVWGDVGPALDVMRRLKAELDPAGILNPGRYVGGI
jgi:glycolate oxidase FAD binding subunit